MTTSPIIEPAVNELSTLLDMLRWTVSRFNSEEVYFGHGTDNAWDEARSLVTQAVHLPFDIDDRLLDARLTAAERQTIAELVQARIEQRVPLAYLTNQAWFCGLPFYVDERVLVPRSPFAELIQNRFAPFVNSEPEHILDMCTGSGCIAIALAYEYPEAQVDAVDISPDALAVAEINIEQHGLNDRVFPIYSDGFSGVGGQKYDLIVANPPYVDAEDMADLPDEFRHEPELGLASGEDGLELTDELLARAPEHLTDEGWLLVEIGNSMVHFEQRYPGLEVIWVELEHGGHGIFAISRQALVAYQEQQD
ncbi:Ribosomal protein L3 N(5)-glutamine methyltransferase [Saliniradius amylolyticus]|uniref:Ribosomal protein uL3 glutamine methyltransferase n=1 Tax=Saliniradius amylolyticus TaxID=2183582 RepID=A0A2S2E647_9ALTE|nr:50S ribosomal protein L3 N(5)-glutamine methyltransferase [Saliniradius amylolyticus]AWL12437.1 Ribosomal protein L3 N(5)-glutamine methyltransferase [Saliniradius amylolyticus]